MVPMAVNLLVFGITRPSLTMCSLQKLPSAMGSIRAFVMAQDRNKILVELVKCNITPKFILFSFVMGRIK
jgi:hypothetical protein